MNNTHPCPKCFEINNYVKVENSICTFYCFKCDLLYTEEELKTEVTFTRDELVHIDGALNFYYRSMRNDNSYRPAILKLGNKISDLLYPGRA